MVTLFFYAPESHLDSIKEAMFAEHAGEIGHYRHCAWQTVGQGQFMPTLGSNPFAGRLHQLEHTTEVKVEMVCDEKYLTQVIAALKQAHPYEEPAYGVIRLEAF